MVIGLDQMEEIGEENKGKGDIFLIYYQLTYYFPEFRKVINQKYIFQIG